MAPPEDAEPPPLNPGGNAEPPEDMAPPEDAEPPEDMAPLLPPILPIDIPKSSTSFLSL
jgi:hypothetical protein